MEVGRWALMKKFNSSTGLERGLLGVVFFATLLVLGYTAMRDVPSVPRDPYSVYGSVYDPWDELVGEGVAVEVTNLDTVEQLSGWTNQEGKYVFDISALPTGYSEGDRILVEAQNPSGYGSAEGVVDLSQPGIMIDVYKEMTVGNPPSLLLAGLIVVFFFAGSTYERWRS